MKSTREIYKRIHHVDMGIHEIYKVIHVIKKGIHATLSFKQIYKGIHGIHEGNLKGDPLNL